MSKREYSLPKWPGSPWDYVTLAKHRDKLLGSDRDCYPYLFLKAVQQYTDKKFVFQSEIFEGLQKWREYAKRHPESAPSCRRAISPSTDEHQSIEDFKELLLAGAFYDQKEILQTLLETATLIKPPETDMHAVRAVITAFANLWRAGPCPNKKEVKMAAIEILKEAGSLIPRRREWPRIFRKAGLKGLHTATRRLKPDESCEGHMIYVENLDDLFRKSK